MADGLPSPLSYAMAHPQLEEPASGALRHPRYTANALMHDLLGVDERFLASLTNTSPHAGRTFLNEPFCQTEFGQYVQKCAPALLTGSHPGNDPYAKKVLLQYAIVRATAPDLIVETGVASGISSTYLLMACRQNCRGRVYSIDINNGEYLPPGKPTGWIVPEYLRPDWTLLLCDPKVLLPRLLADLGEIDMFIHDSSHTYEHMKFEFEASYSHIRSGGLLLSDDANFNRAFEECVASFHPATARIVRNVGVMKKR
jgi:Methyltransferase domain